MSINRSRGEVVSVSFSLFVSLVVIQQYWNRDMCILTSLGQFQKYRMKVFVIKILVLVFEYFAEHNACAELKISLSLYVSLNSREEVCYSMSSFSLPGLFTKLKWYKGEPCE